MAASWSDYAVVVNYVFDNVPNAAPTRSDFLGICFSNAAGEVSEDVIDGFDALREGVMFDDAEQVKAALQAAGQLTD